MFEKYADQVRYILKDHGFTRDSRDLIMEVFEAGWDAAINYLSGQTVKWEDIKNHKANTLTIVTKKSDELLN